MPERLRRWLYNFGRTDRNLMQQLIAPGVLAAGATAVGVLFHRTERAREERHRQAEQEREERQRQVECEREERERQAEIERDESRERSEALEAYLDWMSHLLLKERLAEPGEERAGVRTVALARTLTTISRLDESRNGYLLRFLRDTGLIVGANSIIPLSRTALPGVDLHRTDLSDANLGMSNLSSTDLERGNLARATLIGAT